MLEELQPCILEVVNDFEVTGIPPDSVVKPVLIRSDAETVVDLPTELDITLLKKHKAVSDFAGQ
jgi:hypothetical protein